MLKTLAKSSLTALLVVALVLPQAQGEVQRAYSAQQDTGQDSLLSQLKPSVEDSETFEELEPAFPPEPGPRPDCLEVKCIALTFDDGPDRTYTPKVLDILSQNDVRATFFIVGSAGALHSDLLLRASEPYAFATGYFGMPEKTVEAWRNLWFHTGDRVVCDADGYFSFMDRLKDAIRRRGENISSFEVEQVLLSHPAVEVAAVFPVKSEMAEDEVMTTIVLREGATLGEIELMQFCEPRLSYFAVPRYVEFLPQLPATENGKIQKFKLRERGVTPQTWDREAAGYQLVR